MMSSGESRPTPERGCVSRNGTSRSNFAKPACWNTSDVVELFNVLRLVLLHTAALQSWQPFGLTHHHENLIPTLMERDK
jgi:hypothetical protein